MEYHFGVYARISAAGCILLVHKTRGPYTNLLDLPGGRPEPGESWPQTLERELQEELGLRITAPTDFTPFTLHVRESSAGEPINLHHHGVYADVALPTALPTTSITSSDTAGSEWFNPTTDNHRRLSALAREVLA
ncbi:hypothetical protein GCM10009804_61560 [Kribbella hippodromi]|uniref:Nudix hydrolase domain-containing protein n=1 Tax=Kribbella hippodromi TaxID=434347 RepID=A0ABN2E576_9ACTN